MVFNTQNLILQQSHIGSFILDFLQSALLFLMVTDKMIIFSLFFHQLMVHFKKLIFSIKLLRNVVLVIIIRASKINKSISFDDWISFYVELRYLHFRAFKQTVYVIVLFSGARPCLLWVTVNRNLVRKFSNGGFFLFFITKIGNLITCIIKIRNITKISR